MGLEEVKELIECKNVIFHDKSTRKKIDEPSKELTEIEKYEVINNHFGVAFSSQGILSLSQTLKLVKKNPNKDYILIPVRENDYKHQNE